MRNDLTHARSHRPGLAPDTASLLPFERAAFAALVLLAGDASSQEVPFRRTHELVPEGNLFDAIPADWDGDGDADLVLSGLGFLENLDHGRFLRRSLSGPTSDRPLAAADLDLDGLSDLVALDPMFPAGPSVLDVWINPGGGAFVAPSSNLSPVVPDTGLTEVAVGDLDSDGDDDVYGYEGTGLFLYGNGGPDTLFWNDGSGAFQPGAAGTPQGLNTRRVELADLDRDGDLDVLLADDVTHVLWVNDGARSFRVAAQQPVPSGTVTYSLHVADLDADGLQDILTGNPPRLFENEGEGRFTDAGPVLPALPKYSPFLYPLMDLDGDEFPDAMGYVDYLQRGLPSKLNNALLFFRNDGTGRFEADIGALPLPPKAGISAVLDVDGDHDLDLISPTPSAERGPYYCYYGLPQQDLWLNDGRGCFTRIRDRWETGALTDSVAAGDLDGDSFPDVLAIRTFGVYLYHNLGNGAFSEELAAIPQRNPDDPCLGDVDGDGDLDVFAWGPSLLLNDGRGGLTDATASLPDPTFFGPYSELRDLDGDADLDLLLVVQVTSKKWQGHVWSNDGQGRFTDRVMGVPSTSSYVASLLVSDMDGDLDPDAAILPGRLWLNDGNSGFTNVSSATVSPFVGSTGALADLEGDGDLDVLSRYSDCFDDCITWQEAALNDGLGTFTAAPALWPNPGCQDGRISVADFDEDGDPDVIDGNRGFWLNDGTGQLEDESYELPHIGGFISRVAIADFDLDGDLDVWYPGYPRPVMNTTRHVSWRSYPRVGKPLTMEVFGPAGTPFQLFSSPRFTGPQKTDMGFLRLATRGARLVATGTLDAEGKAAVTLGVPSDVALPESTIYWQALVGSPARLTNLELTRFSNL